MTDDRMFPQDPIGFCTWYQAWAERTRREPEPFGQSAWRAGVDWERRRVVAKLRDRANDLMGFGRAMVLQEADRIERGDD